MSESSPPDSEGPYIHPGRPSNGADRARDRSRELMPTHTAASLHAARDSSEIVQSVNEPTRSAILAARILLVMIALAVLFLALWLASGNGRSPFGFVALSSVYLVWKAFTAKPRELAPLARLLEWVKLLD